MLKNILLYSLFIIFVLLETSFAIVKASDMSPSLTCNIIERMNGPVERGVVLFSFIFIIFSLLARKRINKIKSKARLIISKAFAWLVYITFTISLINMNTAINPHIEKCDEFNLEENTIQKRLKEKCYFHIEISGNYYCLKNYKL